MDAKGDSRSQHLLRYYMANKYEGDAYEMLSSSTSLPLGGSPRSIHSSDEELRLSSSGSQTAGSEKDIYYKIYDFVNEDSHDNLRSSSSSFFGQPQDYDDKPKKVSYSMPNPSDKDWNKEFQDLLELPDTEEKFTKIRHLAQDFISIATNCAKIIISELYMQKKTIKPLEIGGIAGGDKYLYRNILFKFALDVELKPNYWMYGGPEGSDERAMKGASHELKGLMHYSSIRVPGVYFPLMILIDYKGYRMTAQSFLPIHSDTIRYGSSNGGSVVHADIPDLVEKIKKIGEKLNLCAHKVKDKTIYGPGDQEVHIGTDGRYYCIDLARVFPCEAPKIISSETRSIFYELLRPEFVLKNEEPLNSDAFTAWSRSDPNHGKHNARIEAASHHLHKVVIGGFAKFLDKQDYVKQSLIENFQSLRLIEILHREGINLRHLGRVRARSNSPIVQKLLLSEMVVRVIKNIIRQQFRDIMKESKYLSEEQMKEVFVTYLNLITGYALNSKSFWKNITKLVWSKFPESISSQERQQPSFKLQSHVDISFVIRRLSDKLGIEISRDLVISKGAELIYCDIESVQPKIRFINILDEAEGMSLLLLALKKEGNTRLRLLKLAARKFEMACANLPTNYIALQEWGRSLLEYSKLISKESQEYETVLASATQKYSSALQLHESEEAYKHYNSVLIGRLLYSPLAQELSSALIRDLTSSLRCYLKLRPTKMSKLLNKIQKLWGLYNTKAVNFNRERLLEICLLISKIIDDSIQDTFISNNSKVPKVIKSNLISGNVMITAIKNLLLSAIISFEHSKLTEAIKDSKNTFMHVMNAVHTKISQIRSIEKYVRALTLPVREIDPSNAAQCDVMILKHISHMIGFLANSANLRFALDNKLSAITEISLNDDDVFDKAIPMIALKSQQLKSLSVANVSYLQTKLFVEHVPKIISLTSLDLSNSPINDACLMALTTLTNLRTLDLSKIQVGHITTDDSLKHFFKFCGSNLEQLDVSNTRRIKSGSISYLLANTTRLQHLNLNGLVNINDDTVVALERSPAAGTLKSIHMIGVHTGLTERVLDVLATRTTSLTDLSLGTIKQIADSLSKLATLAPKLKILTLKGLNTTDVGFMPILSNLNNATRLVIRACLGLTDKSLAALPASNTSLQSLSLGGCHNITGECFVTLRNTLTNLTSLDLSDVQLHPMHFKKYVERLHLLSHLELNFCQTLDDDCFIEVFPHLPFLRTLSLESAHVTDVTVKHLVKHCPHLENLDLTNCLKLTDKSLNYLTLMKSLKELSIKHCYFSAPALENLQEKLPLDNLLTSSGNFKLRQHF